jgi:hypothetical protein
MTCPRLVQCRVQVEAAFVLTRTDLRRNPAEDVIEFSDGVLEILTAGKRDSPSADRGKARYSVIEGGRLCDPQMG